MSMLELFRRARWIVLILLAVYLISFGTGYAVGKLKLVELGKIRASAVFGFDRNLDIRVPFIGPHLQRYMTGERQMLMRNLSRRGAVSTMFIIFLNNWIFADGTQIVRAIFVAPLVFYPFERFVQGLVLAHTRSGYQAWMIGLTEFGGYFMTLCGIITLLLWTAFFGRFRFASRGRAFFSGLRVFAVFYSVSAVFFFIGAYIEMMNLLGLTLR
ncbi:MAG: hypothetical protein ABSA30_03915 [Candidatus Aminicenantales bacterium]|jgi:hypothetical protein